MYLFNHNVTDFDLRDYPFYPSLPSYSFSEEQSTMEIVRLTAELATLGERVTIFQIGTNCFVAY